MDDGRGRLSQPLGESEVFLDFQRRLSRAATVDRSVLVVGERGSGKEIAAARLHYLSPRWQNSLVTVNCAALPPSLIETELFGYEQGAFTGAQKTRKGRFEEAEGGTLFLDEIGLIPLEVQEKILRVVEYGTYERVGSSKTHEANVRIVGATNADLPQLCAEGKFKEDLLDRLSFEVLFLPPLRERGDDILLLANFFAAKMAMECGREEMPVLSDSVQEQLMRYPWPGNVRELKNVVERAVYRSESRLIDHVDFNPFSNPFAKCPPVSLETSSVPVPDGEVALPVAVDVSGQEGVVTDPMDVLPLSDYEGAKERLDVSFLRRALEQAEGNQREAAKLLGLTYDQFRGLYRNLKVKMD
jgi:psp operon transcriptional activator